MTYSFLPTPPTTTADKVVATATNGVCYTENNRLHIKNNKRHLVYKYDGNPVGWYARNPKNFDDIFLGNGASPTIEFETLQIKDENTWANILKVETQEEV